MVYSLINSEIEGLPLVAIAVMFFIDRRSIWRYCEKSEEPLVQLIVAFFKLNLWEL